MMPTVTGRSNSLARAPVVQINLAVDRQAGLGQERLDLLFARAVEDGRRDPEAEFPRRPAEMRFQQLAEVHAGRHADRVEDDVHRPPIGQVGHILDRQDAGDDALVAVAARHLVALGDLPALRDHHAHHLVDPGGQFVVVLARVFLDIDDRAARTVRHAQARVLHIARLLTEDRAQAGAPPPKGPSRRAASPCRRGCRSVALPRRRG